MSGNGDLQRVSDVSGIQFLPGHADLCNRSDLRRKRDMSRNTDLRGDDDLYGDSADMRRRAHLQAEHDVSGWANLCGCDLYGGRRDLRPARLPNVLGGAYLPVGKHV
jgi:hypothetical protein